jgi:aminotransferase in exopolysaccharide biosynthesis
MMVEMNDLSLSAAITKAIRNVVGEGFKPLHEPSFDGNELDYLKECIDSTYVSSVGKYVDKFENELAKFTGAKFAISVSSGTAALHISLLLAGVGENDEVLIPALTFVATANAVTYCNAVPHFVDIEESHLGIDPDKLREYLLLNTITSSGRTTNKATGRVIKAIIPMHTFGHPARILDILELAREFNLAVVEDAAESLGSFYNGQHTGTFGMFGAISFNGNKVITTGGGGAILTNDESLAKRAKHLTTTAKLPHRWEFRHDEVGFNYRMPNLNAALGCAQLETLSAKLDSKRKLYESYNSEMNKIKGVKVFEEPRNSQSNYWLQTLVLDDPNDGEIARILEFTNKSGLMTRPIWTPLNLLSIFCDSPCSDLSITETITNRIINIPSSPNLLATE